MNLNRRSKQIRLWGRHPTLAIFAFLALLFFSSVDLLAKPVSDRQAERIVKGWLKAEARPLGTLLGQKIEKVDTFPDDKGESMYYVVYLQPSGFVIVPADDRVEPIICFSRGQTYNPSDDNPLGALVSRDVPARIAAAKAMDTASGGLRAKSAIMQRAAIKARDKWSQLNSYDDANNLSMGLMGTPSISDIRVAPIVQSEWGQTWVCYEEWYCYNYYTPNHWPCGCVATATAQLMRFHEYPVGTYVWSGLVLKPEEVCGTITLSQRQALGALCYDVAEAVDMEYGENGSSAYLSDAKDALLTTFSYTNAIYGSNYLNSIPEAARNSMINPNLDANHPVILGVYHSVYGDGHALLADGYGYNASTLYHHLNMGWDGYDDAWYNLPTIDSYYDYDTVDECVYNIFTSGSGEIISGRVTDPAGQPISGVGITASGGGTHYATTNNKGIYALAKVPSNTAFTITAIKSGWSFSSRIIRTGRSIHDMPTSGNVWGADFTGTVDTSTGTIRFDKESYDVSETVTITVVDGDLQGNGSQDVVVKTCGGDFETVTLTENPSNSAIFKGSITIAQGAIYVEDGLIQVEDGDAVIGIYQDNDDGTGQQAKATDTASINPSVVLLNEQFSSGIPGNWSVINGYGGHTWQPANSVEWQYRDYWDGTLSGYFVVVDSDSFYEDMDEQLITPSMDCSTYDNVQLSFKHWFVYNDVEIADVDIRADGGPWQNVARYKGYDTSGVVELDISSIAAGHSNVQVRWHYYDAYWEYYWGVDDVEVRASGSVQLPIGDFEPDCVVDFYDFAILGQAWQSSSGQPSYNPACDISEPSDGIIDEFDLDVFVQNWLEGMP